MTIFECYRNTVKLLKEAEIEDASFEARQLIRYITKLSNSEIITRYNDKLEAFQLNMWRSVMEQRMNHYPLQYIIGEWSFYGLNFFVGEGCLIPRADTEVLVDTAFGFLEKKPTAKVLDLCAGSGCVGITIANRYKETDVTLVEKYDVPYSYCEKNIHRNPSETLRVIKADIFDWTPKEKYDLIVSNPPYISAADMEKLSSEVLCEPDSALYGGEDGLDFYRVILRRFLPFLSEGGRLAVEVGYDQKDTVTALFKEAGLKDINTAEDINGIQRVVYGTLSSV
ncbi:MAG: peptide chain release factor N(5)-glutamine methyltransferase [Acutalibacteraceae bacterium]|nr:peptide chain release factor N(5)-glutamine methyltransferase [Acutalibacteraceae bacterium]